MPEHDGEFPPPVENKVPDLLEALQESFEDAKRRRAERGEFPPPTDTPKEQP